MESTVGARRAQRLDSLTGARGVAAGVVFLSHIATGGVFAAGSSVQDVLATATKTAGTIGVSFFFLLSGFVLTWSARPTDTYGGFLRRRLVKIYPNHVVTFCLALVLLAAAVTPPGTAVLNLLLLQSWSSDPSVFLSVNGSSWSLACELLAYALFPLLLLWIRRIGDGRLWWWAGGVAAAVMLLPVASQLLPANPVFPPGSLTLTGVPMDRLWFVYIFPPARLLDFVLGMLMARIVLSGRWIRLGTGWSALLVVAGYVLGIFTPMLYTVDAATIVPLALFVAALGSADNTGLRTGLTSRPVILFGEASFAFYLLHGVVLQYLRTLIERELTIAEGVLFSVVSLALSTLLALAMHRWIEMPAVRRWGRARPAAASAGAVPAPEGPSPAARGEESTSAPA